MMPQATVFLVQTTILATVAGSLPDEIPRRRIHLLLNIRVQVQAGFELKNRNKIRRVDQSLVFRAFRVAKRPLVSQLSQRIDPLLNRPANLEINDSTCGLGVEATAQGLQNPIQATRSAHVNTLARTVRPSRGQRTILELTASGGRLRRVSVWGSFVTAKPSRSRTEWFGFQSDRPRQLDMAVSFECDF